MATRYFYNDYETHTIGEIGVESFRKHMKRFRREKQVVPFQSRIQYLLLQTGEKSGEDDREVAKVVSSLNPTRTIVVHLDSEADIYIEGPFSL